LHIDNEEVREVCDRLVQVIMRDEEGEGEAEGEKKVVEMEEDEDEDEQIIDVL
jgi:Domain of unknown function (DUF384)